MSYKSTIKQFQRDLDQAFVHLKNDPYFKTYLQTISDFREQYILEATNVGVRFLDQAKSLGAANALNAVLQVANHNNADD